MATTEADVEPETDSPPEPISEAPFFWSDDKVVGSNPVVVKFRTVIAGRQLELIEESDKWDLDMIASRNGSPVGHFTRTE